MDKFLAAAAGAWNPAGEVRRRIDLGTLTLSSVVVSAVAAIIACNLFQMAAWSFFWNSTFHGLGAQVPEIAASQFVVQMGSTIGALAPIAALSVLPAKVFEPVGRSSSGAAMLVVLAANAFYAAAFASLLYLIAGAQAWDNPQLGMSTFQLLSGPMVIVVTCLTLFFWWRVALSILKLRFANFIGISVVATTALLGLFGLIMLLASASAAS